MTSLPSEQLTIDTNDVITARLTLTRNNDKTFSATTMLRVSVTIIFVVSCYLKWKFMHMRTDSSVVTNVTVLARVRLVFMSGLMNLTCPIVVPRPADLPTIPRIRSFSIRLLALFLVGGTWITTLRSSLKPRSTGLLKLVPRNVLCTMLTLVGPLSATLTIALLAKLSF